jgi:hypothetical protein
MEPVSDSNGGPSQHGILTRVGVGVDDADETTMTPSKSRSGSSLEVTRIVTTTTAGPVRPRVHQPANGVVPATFSLSPRFGGRTARQRMEEQREMTVMLITGANKGLGYETARQRRARKGSVIRTRWPVRAAGRD